MKKISVLLFFLFTSALSLLGQDINSARLQWTITSLTDLNSATTSDDYDAAFETNGTQSILWKQKGGTRITTLTVSSTEGTWSNVQNMGKVTYHITSNGKSGTLVFERLESKVHIVLDLPLNADSKLSYDFLVSSTTVVQ